MESADDVLGAIPTRSVFALVYMAWPTIDVQNDSDE